MEDHPYRYSSPKEDVVNTRLDSLENGLALAKKVTVISIILGVVVSLSAAIAVAASTRNELLGTSSCRDETKIGRPRSAQDGAFTLQCDHPRHRGLFERSDDVVILTCACR